MRLLSEIFDKNLCSSFLDKSGQARGLYLPAGRQVGNPVSFKNKDFWIPAYRRQARWSLPSNFVIGGGYDGKSVLSETFARASI